MSIEKRVGDAFQKMLEDDAEGALFNICAAVEATAALEGKKGKKGYKAWLRDNMPIILGIAWGVPLAGVSLFYDFPGIEKDADGSSTLESIFYQVARCCLYHEAQLPRGFELSKNQWSGDPATGSLAIPKGVVLGLIMAVIASPKNAGRQLSGGEWFEQRRTRFVLNEWWGRRDELRAELSRLAAEDGALAERSTA